MFKHYDPNDPKSVKSRSGFVVTLGSIPVSWSSELQTETALSTMESEYICLSQSMRVLIPLGMLLQELTNALNLNQIPNHISRQRYLKTIRLVLPLPPLILKMTPRSKSIAVKYHWFCEHLVPGILEVKPIDTNDQAADIFTKPLPPQQFEQLRRILLGW